MTPPFILDTDTLSLYQLKHPRVTTAVRANLTDTSVTIITVEEQFEGWRALLRQPARPDQLARQYLRWTEAVASLAPFTILPFTESAILRFAGLARTVRNVGRMDLRIAAIALEAGATVVTRNRRDFQRAPNLTIEDWSV